MSIASEIERLQTAKGDLKTSIENKGVTVPEGATLDDYPALVDSISGGGGEENPIYITAGTSSPTQANSYSNVYHNYANSGNAKLTIQGTNAEYMFYDVPQRQLSIYPKLLNTENVTNMRSMYFVAHCVRNTSSIPNYIQDFNVSHFNTSNVTNMRSMFNAESGGDYTKIKLDLSHWNTDKVTTMYRMFWNRFGIISLDISSFNLSTVGDIYQMFYNVGTSCLQSDGAYADGIPYIYVKDATSQNIVLTQTECPSTWSTANVVIKSQLNQG